MYSSALRVCYPPPKHFFPQGGLSPMIIILLYSNNLVDTLIKDRKKALTSFHYKIRPNLEKKKKNLLVPHYSFLLSC